MKEDYIHKDFIESDALDFYPEETMSRNAPELDGDTFRQRNDPSPLLKEWKLELTACYEKTEETTDETTGEIKKVHKIKKKKNTTPVVNKQGAEEILNFFRGYINSHMVQGNFITGEIFNNYAMQMSNDFISILWAKRIDWGVTIPNAVMLTKKRFTIAEYMTRLIQDAERKHYTEGYKETTQINKTPVEKTNWLQKMMSGGRK